jgi:hypothetical protein
LAFTDTPGVPRLAVSLHVGVEHYCPTDRAINAAVITEDKSIAIDRYQIPVEKTVGLELGVEALGKSAEIGLAGKCGEREARLVARMRGRVTGREVDAFFEVSPGRFRMITEIPDALRLRSSAIPDIRVVRIERAAIEAPASGRRAIVTALI